MGIKKTEDFSTMGIGGSGDEGLDLLSALSFGESKVDQSTKAIFISSGRLLQMMARIHYFSSGLSTYDTKSNCPLFYGPNPW